MHSGVSSADDINVPPGPCWFTWRWGFNEVHDECTYYAKYNGLYCDNTHTVRRLVIYAFKPNSLKHQKLWVLPYDDSIIDPLKALPTLNDYKNYINT